MSNQHWSPEMLKPLLATLEDSAQIVTALMADMRSREVPSIAADLEALQSRAGQIRDELTQLQSKTLAAFTKLDKTPPA